MKATWQTAAGDHRGRVGQPLGWEGDLAPACVYFDVGPEPGRVPFDLGAIIGTAPVAFDEYVDAIRGVDVDERTTNQEASWRSPLTPATWPSHARSPCSTP